MDLTNWGDVGGNLNIRVQRILNGEPPDKVHALFQRSFGSNAPNFGVHFLCFAKEDGEQRLLAYGHCTPREHYYLGGGMCTDLRQLRQLSKTARSALELQGGAACMVVRGVFQWCIDKPAVFGHVGHPVAREIDLKAGFEPTQYPHLMVYWTNPAHRPLHLIDEAFAEGPF